MKRRLPILAAVGLGLFAACRSDRSPTGAAPSSMTQQGDFQARHPHVHVFPLRRPTPERSTTATTTENGIYYHGGPIIIAQKVATIYWSSSTIYSGGPAPGTAGPGTQDASLIGFFLRNLGGSPYFNINVAYYNGSSARVQNSVAYTQYWASNTNVPTPGSSVSDAQVQAQVIAGFNSGNLVFDGATLYAVFSGPGVNLGGGFGTNYCAYHGHFTWNGNDVKYAVMPYDADFFGGCTVLSDPPNGDYAADAEVNTLAHETEETTTDPDLNAWFDNSGLENADKCAWTFGTTYPTGNGGTANMNLGGKDFLVQRNWVNDDGGRCDLFYVSATITGSDYIYYQESTTCTYYASASGGVAPYQYQWSFQLPVQGYSPENGKFIGTASGTSGSGSLTVTATDAAGHQRSATKVITIQPYSPPCT